MAERAARDRAEEEEAEAQRTEGFSYREERLVGLRRWKDTPGALVRELRGHDGPVLALAKVGPGREVRACARGVRGL